MSKPSHTALGAFVLIGGALTILVMGYYIYQARDREQIELVTYLPHAGGLDVGNTVKASGINVGEVVDLSVAPDQDMVAVRFGIFVDRLRVFGVDVDELRRDLEGDAPSGSVADLRVQMVSNPITGISFLDMVTPKHPPPPIAVEWTPPVPYVSSMEGAVASILGDMSAALKPVPEMMAKIESLTTTAEATLKREDITELIRRSNAMLANATTLAKTADGAVAELQGELSGLIGSTQDVIVRNGGHLDELLKAEGPVTSLLRSGERAIDEAQVAETSAVLRATLDEATRSLEQARRAMEQVRLLTDDLRGLSPDVRESLISIQDLTRHLSQEPESILYGPRPEPQP